MTYFSSSIRVLKQSNGVFLLSNDCAKALAQWSSESKDSEYLVLHHFIEFKKSLRYQLIKHLAPIHKLNHHIKQLVRSHYSFTKSDLINEVFLTSNPSTQLICGEYILQKFKLLTPENIKKIKDHSNLFLIIKGIYLLSQENLLNQLLLDWMSQEEHSEDAIWGIIALKSTRNLHSQELANFIEHYQKGLGKILYYLAFANLTPSKWDLSEEKLLQDFQKERKKPHLFFKLCILPKRLDAKIFQLKTLPQIETCLIKSFISQIYPLEAEIIEKLAIELEGLKFYLATHRLNPTFFQSLLESIAQKNFITRKPIIDFLQDRNLISHLSLYFLYRCTNTDNEEILESLKWLESHKLLTHSILTIYFELNTPPLITINYPNNVMNSPQKKNIIPIQSHQYSLYKSQVKILSPIMEEQTDDNETEQLKYF